MREVVDLAEQRSVLVIEPALPRPILAIGVPEVPLAHDRGPVARLLQDLGQQPFVSGQPIAMGVAAGHQRGPRRRAHRLGIKLLEPRSPLGELVDVRRLDVGAVEADVLPSLVVRQDVDDVGAGRRGLGRSQRHPSETTGR